MMSIFLLLPLAKQAQCIHQTVRYNIRVFGMNIGQMTVNQVKTDTCTIVQAISEISVRIIFIYQVKYIQNTTYQFGELYQSSLKTLKKEEVNYDTRITKTEDGYILVKDGDTSRIEDKILYSGGLLYFNEPQNITSLYFEISGDKKPIERIDDHTYCITDPNNGRKSNYEYKDGILKRAVIRHRLATIYVEQQTI